MDYTEIMVRYGELSTKGKNRRDFIGRLNGNVTKSLLDFPLLKIHGKADRMHINLNGQPSQPVMDRIAQVFGIQNFSPSLRVEKTVADMEAGILALLKPVMKAGTTFKVNTRRSDHTFEMDTNTLNREMGAFVLQNFPGSVVQMHDPEITLRVEVRADGIYLSHETIQGAGGLPVGTAGKAMLMLSGGIDSPVAGYLAMKRGVAIEMVHFFSPPFTSGEALAKAKDLTAKLAPYTGSIQFIQVPFTEIQSEIKRLVPEGYLMTVQRRFMLRLTDKIREMRGGLAIFNGESVGQVASQTLESMLAINDVTTTPIVRPVATMDKNEIIKIAEQIDTFNLSIQPFEDCCTIFAPKQPKTKPNLEKTCQYEARLPIDQLIDEAIAGITITEIKIGDQYLNATEPAFEALL